MCVASDLSLGRNAKHEQENAKRVCQSGRWKSLSRSNRQASTCPVAGLAKPRDRLGEFGGSQDPSRVVSWFRNALCLADDAEFSALESLGNNCHGGYSGDRSTAWRTWAICATVALQLAIVGECKWE